MKSIAFALSLLVLAGCGTMPGGVTKTESMLDGERQIRVNPGWLYAGGMKMPTLKAGGFWSEKAPDHFVLLLVSLGNENLESAKVGIDGKIIDLLPVESAPTEFRWISGTYTQFGSHPGHAESSRQFLVPLQLVREMVDAKRAVVQLHFTTTYSEAIFTFNQPHYARRSFEKAIKQIDEARSIPAR